ncbi:MAG: methyltransferase domain-containing protein [Proteobacteria bacterium]|nr:methyltransferase domain-containing protein [Pseudomonadota bacterium]
MKTTTSQEHLELGQFIPFIYHHNMLADPARMEAFREAIAIAVPAGSNVLDLGGGTGVLSFFAAQRASRVWCVERNPELVQAAGRLLSINPGAERVEVIQADAFDYLPPEPVDVVICEMLHVGMLREKQVPVLASFKRRYLEKFGAPLPLFLPEAFLQAVQPVQQSFDFNGYYAPIPSLQDPSARHQHTRELAKPALFQVASYGESLPMDCAWQGEITITESGSLNALRFITKNVLTIVETEQRSIDWFSQYLIMPLSDPLEVTANQQVSVSFAYTLGDPIARLKPIVTLID